MSAGACVVASDLGAFQRVLDDGKAGYVFRVGDSDDLARTVVDALRDPDERARRTGLATATVRQYDWSTVTAQVLTVYEMVLEATRALGGVEEDPSSRARRRGWTEVTS